MILDLFAGPGGWDEWLRSIGITDVVGLEWDAAACATRAAAGHKTIRCDVAEYPTDPFRGRVRGLIASPPCQAWSMAGKGAGRGEVDRVHAAVELCRNGWTDEPLAWEWADPRTPLILQPLRWAWALRPTWIACEQVPPALGVWQHIADVFRSWGYAADCRILCAADYGVPQTRDRAFIIAATGALRWPEPTHAEKPEPSLFGASRKPWVTMAVALGWEPGSRAWDRRVGGFAKDAACIPDTRPAPTLTGTGGLAKGKDVWRTLPRWTPELIESGEWPHYGPATTIAGDPRVFAPGGHHTPGKQSQHAIRIEVSEAATLQGFTAPYPWQGSRREQFEQIGNVVCPPVAAAITSALDTGATAHREAA